MSILRSAIDKVGGVKEAALICGISPRAVYKWLDRDRLPRSDYTGETSYAELLSSACDGAFNAEELRDELRQKSA